MMRDSVDGEHNNNNIHYKKHEFVCVCVASVASVHLVDVDGREQSNNSRELSVRSPYNPATPLDSCFFVCLHCYRIVVEVSMRDQHELKLIRMTSWNCPRVYTN